MGFHKGPLCAHGRSRCSLTKSIRVKLYLCSGHPDEFLGADIEVLRSASRIDVTVYAISKRQA